MDLFAGTVTLLIHFANIKLNWIFVILLNLEIIILIVISLGLYRFMFYST